MQSNADVPLWLQFDFNIDMLQPSEKVPDVILATEARTQQDTTVVSISPSRKDGAAVCIAKVVLIFSPGAVRRWREGTSVVCPMILG